MHWGQFVDHDLDLALASTSKVSYVTGIVLCAIVKPNALISNIKYILLV